jgi:hypothetical protein
MYTFREWFSAVASKLRYGKLGRACKKRARIRLEIESLEERWVPVATTTWDPAGVNDLASNANNWNAGLPDDTTQAVFDGNVANSVCEWDANAPNKVDSIVFKNGYTSQLQIGNNVTLETANQIDLSNAGGQAGSIASVVFNNTGSKLKMDAGNSKFADIQFSGQNGTVYVAGGTLSLTNADASSSTASFLVAGT